MIWATQSEYYKTLPLVAKDRYLDKLLMSVKVGDDPYANDWSYPLRVPLLVSQWNAKRNAALSSCQPCCGNRPHSKSWQNPRNTRRFDCHQYNSLLSKYSVLSPSWPTMAHQGVCTSAFAVYLSFNIPSHLRVENNYNLHSTLTSHNRRFSHRGVKEC